MFEIKKAFTRIHGNFRWMYEIWEGKGFICSCLNREQAEFIVECIKHYDNKDKPLYDLTTAFRGYIK